MTPIDIPKLIVVLVGYLILAPALGLLVSRSRRAQQVLFGSIIFLQCIKASTYGLMFLSIEWYRGHTKGFEFTLVDMLCISLLVACALRRPREFKLFPPGTLLYLFFVAAASFSIIDTFKPHFTIMATFNFAKAVLIYIAVFNFIRSKRDFHVMFVAMAAALMAECVIVLKQKYLGGMFQPFGLFDHQNSMSMWAYFFALPLFGAALSKRTPPVLAWFYLAGVGAAFVLILAALSRGSVAVMIGGCLLVYLLSLIFGGITWRKVAILVVGFVGGTAVIYKAADSIRERFIAADDVGANATGDFRALLNSVSQKMLTDTTIGVGWNNFNVANSRPYPVYSRMYEEYFRQLGHSVDLENYRANANTESLYWMYLAETGYLGFGAMVLFMVVTLFWAVRAFWERGRLGDRDSAPGFFLMGLCVALVALYAHSSIERVLTQTNNLLSWLAFLGVVAVFVQRRRIRLAPKRHARKHLYSRLFREFILKKPPAEGRPATT